MVDLDNSFVDPLLYNEWDKILAVYKQLEFISREFFIGRANLLDVIKWKYSMGGKCKFYIGHVGREKFFGWGVLCLCDEFIGRKKLMLSFDHVTKSFGRDNKSWQNGKLFLEFLKDLHRLREEFVWIGAITREVERVYFRLGCHYLETVFEMEAMLSKVSFGGYSNVRFEFCTLSEYIDLATLTGVRRIYNSTLMRKRITRYPVRTFYTAVKVFVESQKLIGGLLLRIDRDYVCIIDWWLYNMDRYINLGNSLGLHKRLAILLSALFPLVQNTKGIIGIIVPAYLKYVFTMLGFKVKSSIKLLSYPDQFNNKFFISAVDLDLEELLF